MQKYYTRKGKDSQKYFSRKGRDLQKYFSRKGRDLQKYLSIQKKDSNCFGSFRGDKKDMQVHNIYLEQNFNDISVDLNLVAFTAPPLLVSGPEKGMSQGQLNG